MRSYNMKALLLFCFIQIILTVSATGGLKKSRSGRFVINITKHIEGRLELRLYGKAGYVNATFHKTSNSTSDRVEVIQKSVGTICSLNLTVHNSFVPVNCIYCIDEMDNTEDKNEKRSNFVCNYGKLIFEVHVRYNCSHCINCANTKVCSDLALASTTPVVYVSTNRTTYNELSTSLPIMTTTKVIKTSQIDFETVTIKTIRRIIPTMLQSSDQLEGSSSTMSDTYQIESSFYETTTSPKRSKQLEGSSSSTMSDTYRIESSLYETTTSLRLYDSIKETPSLSFATNTMFETSTKYYILTTSKFDTMSFSSPFASSPSEDASSTSKIFTSTKSVSSNTEIPNSTLTDITENSLPCITSKMTKYYVQSSLYVTDTKLLTSILSSTYEPINTDNTKQVASAASSSLCRVEDIRNINILFAVSLLMNFVCVVFVYFSMRKLRRYQKIVERQTTSTA